MKHVTTYIKLVILIIALGTSAVAEAQTDASFTQYWTVKNFYNSAAIGTSDYINIRGGARMQWVGVTNAPKTFLVAAESPFKLFGKRVGAGVVLNQESIGLYKNLNVGLQGAYKFKLFKGQLSVGFQLGIVNETFKGSEVILPDGTDPETGGGSELTSRDDTGMGGDTPSGTDEGIPTTDITGTSFDIGLGIFYTHKYFWAGISATHLNQPNLTLSADESSDKLFEAKIGRIYYFMAGSNIQIKNTLFELQPSVIVRMDSNFTQADITARVRYKKFLSFGIGYRTQDAVSAMIGAEFKNFYLGYSYDYPTSAMSQVTHGSHEVFLGYRLKLNLGEKNKNKHKSIRIM